MRCMDNNIFCVNAHSNKKVLLPRKTFLLNTEPEYIP